jgi:peptidoglycan/xylan/chitin deacetylase (PgdA/CDA1 family)
VSSSLDCGSFIISIDTELAWGAVHSGQFERRKKQYQLARKAVEELLALMEKYDIRATWALVGHLFLEECHPVNGEKHPEIKRPDYSWYSGDWFTNDPSSNLASEPNWYGSDIVQRILNCKVSQEIGCHTFSHVIVGDPGCTRESFESELRACRVQAEKHNLPLRSFIFPRNSINHLDTLADQGFIAYRGVENSWYSRFPGMFSRIGHLLDNFLPTAPPTVMPVQEGRLWNLPASYYFPPTDGVWRTMPAVLRTFKVKQGLREAAKRHQIMHLWFHEFNIATDKDRLLGSLEEIFTEVARLRDKGQIENPTMGEMAISLTRKMKGREGNFEKEYQ